MKIYIEHNEEEFEEVESVLTSLETFHFIDIETDIEIISKEFGDSIMLVTAGHSK